MIKELAKIERVPAQQESRASIAKQSVNTARLDNAVQEDIANQEATSSKPLLECTHMKRPRNDATSLEAGPGADTPKLIVEVSQSSSTQEGENAAPEIKKEDEDANIANVAIKEEDDNEEVSIEDVPAEKSKQGFGAVLSEEKNIDKPSSGSQTTTNTPVETASTANTLAVLEANPSATTKYPGRLHKTPIEEVTAIAMEIIEQNRTKKANSENRELRALETYNSLFLVFYNKPPTISTTDINTALQQSEGLAKLAEHLECVSLVRHHLSNTLLSYGRELYKAILQDPPRWLLLSIYLESAPIFREAIIHIVGMHPIWPWSETATRDYFKPDILALIDRKALYLKTLKAEINSKLFCSSITVDGKEVRLSKSNKATFDTFFVVSLWRDWFVKGIARTKSARGKAMEKPANPGKHVIDVVPYRLMGQGGEAYLSLGETLTMLRDFKGKDFAKWDPREVNEDLMIMKLFAMKEVKPLLASESMLDVEAEGIRYFTCTKIANEELPWVKQE
ncbi:hypothetical protein B0J14DRAFT_222039 [Halenospora varia]|nr:hypothetical protein B0J14DRAFT_222039 [Halenospora varia]